MATHKDQALPFVVYKTVDVGPFRNARFVDVEESMLFCVLKKRFLVLIVDLEIYQKGSILRCAIIKYPIKLQMLVVFAFKKVQKQRFPKSIHQNSSIFLFKLYKDSQKKKVINI